MQLKKNKKNSSNNRPLSQFFPFFYILHSFYVLCLPAHRYGTAELCFHHVLLIAQLVGEDQIKKLH